MESLAPVEASVAVASPPAPAPAPVAVAARPAPAMDYNSAAMTYLSMFSPLLQQQSALFQANHQQAAMFQAYQAGLAMMQEKHRAAQQAAAAGAAAAALEEEEDAAAMASMAPVEPVAEPTEPIPTVSIHSPENKELTLAVESEWRWGAVCLFFEHFLPMFPRSIVFKPELLLQALMCQHHSCHQHKWDGCSCPHPACVHLSGLFLQLMLLLFPIPANCRKLPKNQLNIANYLPVLQSVVEKNYFMPNQEGVRESLQEIMSIFIEAEEAKKARARELAAEQEAMDTSSDEKSAVRPGANSKSLKFSLPIHPPGSALLACHLHCLPAMCKLYLLHFLCEYVLGELHVLKDACTASNVLMHAGDSTPAPTPTPTAAALPGVLPHNPFHSLGISVPHGSDDEGTRYWAFAHEETGRVHLYKDVHTGARDEFHVAHRKKGSTKERVCLTHGNEYDGEDPSDSDDDEDMDGDDMEPIDADHAPPSFTFTLLTSELQNVQDFVAVGLATQKLPASITFLQRLQNDLLPTAINHQKKLERLSRRMATQAASSARAQFLAEAGTNDYMIQRSQRVRKAVNYQEMAEGEHLYREEDDEEDQPQQILSNTGTASRPRRSAVPTPSADLPEAAAASASPAPATPSVPAVATPSAPSPAFLASPSPVPVAASTSPAMSAMPMPASASPMMAAAAHQQMHILGQQMQMFGAMPFAPYGFNAVPAMATPAMAVVAATTPQLQPQPQPAVAVVATTPPLVAEAVAVAPTTTDTPLHAETIAEAATSPLDTTQSTAPPAMSLQA